jgi:hypothetical protein
MNEVLQAHSKLVFPRRPHQLASDLIFKHYEVPRSKKKKEEEDWRSKSIEFRRESSEMSSPDATLCVGGKVLRSVEWGLVYPFARSTTPQFSYPVHLHYVTHKA